MFSNQVLTKKMGKASSELLLPPSVCVCICMGLLFSSPVHLLIASAFRRVEDAGYGWGGSPSAGSKG